MKSKKLLAIAALFIVLTAVFAFTASAKMYEDSEYWQNVSDKEASAMLKSSKNEKNQSFVLIYYSTQCGYSKAYVPQYAEYAKTNSIKVYGIDAMDYRSWNDFTRYVSSFVITYPVVFVYNHTNDSYTSSDKVHSLDSFKNMLTRVDYPHLNKSQVYNPETDAANSLYSDVASSHKNYLAIKLLSAKGVVKGYEDKSFKPDNTITRAEAATMIARTAELPIDDKVASTFPDVAANYWGKPYIMAAAKAGIILGMGDGTFAPAQNVTHNQIIKMVVCMAGLDKDVSKNGGWPTGYLAAARDNSIITKEEYDALVGEKGNKTATRGDVAQYIYNTIYKAELRTLYVGDKKFVLGSSADTLEKPDEKLQSTSAYVWYVYGTDTYKDFYALGVADNKIVAMASSGSGFTYLGFKAGEKRHKSASYAASDNNDGGKIHAFYISLKSYNQGDNVTSETLANESKMNFHFTNGFRAFHGKSILTWDDNAAKAARLHSEDMANQNYFTHDSLDGRTFSKRMTAQGVRWGTCGENIAAGHVKGFDAYHSWVNSAGHRKNMLSASYRYLGVGAGYNSNSQYKGYFTQDFFA